MNNSEKEILLLISQVKIVTENQLKKLYSSKSRGRRNPIKRVLRKMCGDYILNRYPCNVNYGGYKDNTYIYCLNGHKTYRGQDLIKYLIGTDVAINMILSGFDIKRFYRNIKLDDIKCDLYVEYIDSQSNELKQKVIDIQLDEKYRFTKFLNFKNKIRNCTIPFYEVPEIILISDTEKDNNIASYYSNEATINSVNLRLNNLSKYL